MDVKDNNILDEAQIASLEAAIKSAKHSANQVKPKSRKNRPALEEDERNLEAADLIFENQEYMEACEVFEEIMQNGAGNTSTAGKWAFSLARCFNPEKAAEIALNAYQNHPDDPYAYLAMAVVAISEKQFAESLKLLRVASLCPSCPEKLHKMIVDEATWYLKQVTKNQAYELQLINDPVVMAQTRKKLEEEGISAEFLDPLEPVWEAIRTTPGIFNTERERQPLVGNFVDHLVEYHSCTKPTDPSSLAAPIARLDDECWVQLASWLSATDLCRMSSTCRLLRAVIGNDAVWQPLLTSLYGSEWSNPIPAQRAIMDTKAAKEAILLHERLQQEDILLLQSNLRDLAVRYLHPIESRYYSSVITHLMNMESLIAKNRSDAHVNHWIEGDNLAKLIRFLTHLIIFPYDSISTPLVISGSLELLCTVAVRFGDRARNEMEKQGVPTLCENLLGEEHHFAASGLMAAVSARHLSALNGELPVVQLSSVDEEDDEDEDADGDGASGDDAEQKAKEDTLSGMWHISMVYRGHGVLVNRVDQGIVKLDFDPESSFLESSGRDTSVFGVEFTDQGELDDGDMRWIRSYDNGQILLSFDGVRFPFGFAGAIGGYPPGTALEDAIAARENEGEADAPKITLLGYWVIVKARDSSPSEESLAASLSMIDALKASMGPMKYTHSDQTFTNATEELAELARIAFASASPAGSSVITLGNLMGEVMHRTEDAQVEPNLDVPVHQGVLESDGKFELRANVLSQALFHLLNVRLFFGSLFLSEIPADITALSEAEASPEKMENAQRILTLWSRRLRIIPGCFYDQMADIDGMKTFLAGVLSIGQEEEEAHENYGQDERRVASRDLPKEVKSETNNQLKRRRKKAESSTTTTAALLLAGAAALAAVTTGAFFIGKWLQRKE